MTTSNTPAVPAVSGIIKFHGLNLWVVEHHGIEYVNAKPLSDLVGLDWRRTKRTIIEPENAVLYGTTLLIHPVFAAESGSGATPSEGLYMRLDRARMYLARISTRNMKAKGNVEAAEALLKLQIEWAGVLHSYETTGVAIKNNRLDGRRKEEQNLAALFKTRKDANSVQEKQSVTSMIADKLAELGYPLQDADEEQMDLGV